jgi:hypothetical protein
VPKTNFAKSGHIQGMLLTVATFAAGMATGGYVAVSERLDIGVKFKDPRQASLRRELGLLSKDELHAAFPKQSIST